MTTVRYAVKPNADNGIFVVGMTEYGPVKTSEHDDDDELVVVAAIVAPQYGAVFITSLVNVKYPVSTNPNDAIPAMIRRSCGLHIVVVLLLVVVVAVAGDGELELSSLLLSSKSLLLLAAASPSPRPHPRRRSCLFRTATESVDTVVGMLDDARRRPFWLNDDDVGGINTV